jgi:glycosyltransferase involved in cell wall biosynthesis
MKHVCIDGRLIHATGIGSFLKNIFYGMGSIAQFKVSVLCHKKDAKEFLPYSVVKSVIPINAPIYTIQEQCELPLKIPDCDLFWSPHFAVPIFPIRAKKRMTTIHDVFHLNPVAQLSFGKKLYAQLMYKAAIQLSCHVTTDSLFSQGELVTFCAIPLKKLSMIHLGVGSHFYKILDKRKLDAFAKKYNLPASYLLVVGNGKPHKNLNRLFTAFSQVSCDDFLVVVGCENKMSQDKFRFLGFIPDEEMPFVYSLAKALVFPSLYEGFGLPPLEAMACGCPVIASKAASLPEICGNAVEYVDPYSIESIKKGIECVLFSDMRRNELIEAGFRHIQKFSLQSSVDNYFLLINRLLRE